MTSPTVITGRFSGSSSSGGSVAGGGDPPYDGRMEERVKNLEKFADEARVELRAIDTRLTKIETRIDALATKDDMKAVLVEFHKEMGAQTWRLVTFVCGFGTALVAATYFIAAQVPHEATAAQAPAATAAPPAK